MPHTRRKLITVERVIAASPRRVFRAWTEPESIVRWWGPKGITATEAQLEPTAGGRYRIRMQPEGGVAFDVSGEYREVSPQRIVMTWRYSGERVTDPVDSLVSVDFAREGAGTRITVTQEFFGEPPAGEGREKGWNSSLDRLREIMTTH